MECAIELPLHRGTPATWQDRISLLAVCDRHRAQYEERANEFGPFDWRPVAPDGAVAEVGT